jgi:hypothetical protein
MFILGREEGRGQTARLSRAQAEFHIVLLNEILESFSLKCICPFRLGRLEELTLFVSCLRPLRRVQA